MAWMASARTASALAMISSSSLSSPDISIDSRCLSLQTLPVFVQSFLGLPAWSLQSKLSPLGLVFGYCGPFLQVPSVPFPRG